MNYVSLIKSISFVLNECFKHLLSLIGRHLQQTTTRIREPISAAEIFVLTLTFLTSELAEPRFELF